MIRFRLATADDVPQIAPIELAASAMFKDVDMDAIASDPPIPESRLLKAIEGNLLWVGAEYGTVRAYLLAEELPESLHIEQVTVHPESARRGIGAMLIESVCADDRARERGALTLTTFEDVPWNAPYYARIGFQKLDESEWPAAIQSKIADEKAKGLFAWPRIVMIKEISGESRNTSTFA